METYGRERRHRYFTLAAYKCVMASEQLQDTTTSTIDVDPSRVGDFAALDPKHFYTTTGKLHSYQDSFKDITTAKGKKRKRDEGSNGEESDLPPKPKRGRPRKTPVLTDAAATPPNKRGRPRKNSLAKDGVQSAASGGSLSKRMAAERDGQAITSVPPAAGRAMVTSRPANDALLDTVSHSVQFEQNVLPPSVGSSVAVDSNQQSASASVGLSRDVHPAEELAGVPPDNQPSETCDLEAGTWHPASEEGAGDVQSSRSAKITPRRSLKRARPIAFDADHGSVAKRGDDDTIMSCGPQSLESDSPQGRLSVSVVQEEEPTAISVVCPFYLSSWLDADCNLKPDFQTHADCRTRIVANSES